MVQRKIQIALLVIAVGIAGIANADTFAVGDRLLRDDALRAAVVAKATAQANAAKGGGDSVDDVADKVDDVKDLGLPLGWSKENQPNDALRWLWKVLGIAVTAAALSLGAPFWFDLIGKVAQLRGVGGRIGTAKDTSPVAVDRDDRSGVSVIT